MVHHYYDIIAGSHKAGDDVLDSANKDLLHRVHRMGKPRYRIHKRRFGSNWLISLYADRPPIANQRPNMFFSDHPANTTITHNKFRCNDTSLRLVFANPHSI